MDKGYGRNGHPDEFVRGRGPPHKGDYGKRDYGKYGKRDGDKGGFDHWGKDRKEEGPPRWADVPQPPQTAAPKIDVFAALGRKEDAPQAPCGWVRCGTGWEWHGRGVAMDAEDWLRREDEFQPPQPEDGGPRAGRGVWRPARSAALPGARAGPAQGPKAPARGPQVHLRPVDALGFASVWGSAAAAPF